MAKNFISAKGCVYVISRGASEGFYSLNPPLNGSADSPILIDGVDATTQDVVFPVATLDEKNYLYVMGKDFGNVGITGSVLLGSSETRGTGFSAVNAYFEANRAAVRNAPLAVTGPGRVGRYFYMTAFVMSRADPEFHIQFFQLRGLIVEPKPA